MNKRLDNYLCKKYPRIFADRNKPMTETCMCWGVSCQNGWFFLIDNLCYSIQAYIDNHNEWVEKYGEKCKEIVEKDKGSLDDSYSKKIPQVVADQVKEKLGGLRFYYHGGDELIQGMVRLAESLSYRICENCGIYNETVNRNSNGWIKTTCPNCTKKEDMESHTQNKRTELIKLWEKVRKDGKPSFIEELKNAMKTVNKVHARSSQTIRQKPSRKKRS